MALPISSEVRVIVNAPGTAPASEATGVVAATVTWVGGCARTKVPS